MVPDEELTRLVMAARPAPFWLDRPDAPAPREPLRGDASCDLAVIGGGFSGLWTALLAKEANPGRSVVLIEGNRIGWAASGRNGGFCEASLTHGADNGRERFPAEFGTLQRLGAENLDAIEAAIGAYGIACDFERAGTITRVAGTGAGGYGGDGGPATAAKLFTPSRAVPTPDGGFLIADSFNSRIRKVSAAGT